jgi:hypothetical protein
MSRILQTILLAILIAPLHATESEWVDNARERRDATRERDAPYLDVGTIFDRLKGVRYLAIVYPTAMRELRGDHAGHALKATVEYTALGKNYKTITFASLGIMPIPNYPILVGLCGFEAHYLYAPDNGYEMAATKEIIEKVKNFPHLISKPDKKVCPE